MRYPKLCGADVELGNFVQGVDHPGGTGQEASRALLREIAGLPRGGKSSYYGFSYDPQDWGRKFLPSNGGCVYIDLDHLEVCLPEVLSAYDHVAAWHAMLRIARQAQEAANAKRSAQHGIQVLVNNSDGLGHSYGSHLNFLVSRRTYENIFHRKIHHLLYLAAYQASSIIVTGQGKVGAENDMPEVAYQISQRADFFETLTGEQTTYRRPLVNSRDESLCGQPRYFGHSENRPSGGQARLHVIFFDNTLCHVGSLLKVGVMQIVLAMIEAERINPNLILDDPVEAVMRWSHDPTLQTRVRLASGSERTAVEVQWAFWEEAQRFFEEGGCDGIVPRAGEILALWHDTLEKLQARDWHALAGRLDWVLKQRILERAMRQRPELTWQSPQLKHLDHLYSSLDPAEGLYWAYERGGVMERVVSEEQIERLVHEPPEDTRAWTRAMLLRQAKPEEVDDVDWDDLRFKRRGTGYWHTYRRVKLSDPLAFSRSQAEAALQAATLDDVLDAVEALQDGQETVEAVSADNGVRWPAYPLVPVGPAVPVPAGGSAVSEKNGDSAPALSEGGHDHVDS